MIFKLHFNLFLLIGLIEKSQNACDISAELQAEIASYAQVVEEIINATTRGEFKGVTYQELATFVDRFGARRVGSQNLEDSLNYLLNLSTTNNLDNVHGEEVLVPNWIRGEESANLILPRSKKIPILGLIGSIETPIEGLLAEVLVVETFEELILKADLAPGKIIVFNEKWESYGTTNQYRGYGAREAARVGAVATLIRSVTPFSPTNPHTGLLAYDPEIPPIPAACIAPDDANMLQRMQERGDKIQIFLNMSSETAPPRVSQNVVAELSGSDAPEKIVIVSGHVDSVDVGEGAMDDGGGVFISWAVPVLLKRLGLQPKRTIRGIFWTAEEAGGVGLAQYQASHLNDSDNFDLIMDTDVGTFTPLGIQYEAIDESGCILAEILKLLGSINATQAEYAEMGLWPGFPTVSLANANDRYFWFHHSKEDTMDVEDSDDLDKCTAVWAAVAYVVADLSIDLPRN